MEQYIPKSALVAEIERMLEAINNASEQDVRDRDLGAIYGAQLLILRNLAKYLDTLEVKEIDINKLCEFRKNIGFAYPEDASEYQKQLACYRQGIEDVLKAQKGEEV